MNCFLHMNNMKKKFKDVINPKILGQKVENRIRIQLAV